MLPKRCELCGGWMHKKAIFDGRRFWIECKECGIGWVMYENTTKRRNRLITRLLWGKDGLMWRVKHEAD